MHRQQEIKEMDQLENILE